MSAHVAEDLGVGVCLIPPFPCRGWLEGNNSRGGRCTQVGLTAFKVSAFKCTQVGQQTAVIHCVEVIYTLHPDAVQVDRMGRAKPK